MFNPIVTLSIDRLLKQVALSYNKHYSQVALYFIIRALLKLHAKEVARAWVKEKLKLEIDCITYLVFSIVKQLKPMLTEFYYLGMIYKDKGTLNGTYGIHDWIFLHYLNFLDNPKLGDFKDQLQLAYSDQKIVKHI